MSRLTTLGSPLLLGFEEIERFLDRAGKSATDGYPPYNIERLASNKDSAEELRITLAVAGFSAAQLSITLEDNQLFIRGHQSEADEQGDFLHKGIAARQFQRTFVLADGIKVTDAHLGNGLLSISLNMPIPQKQVIQIKIRDLE